MIKARYYPYKLNFIRPSGTSRGVLTEKLSYIILLELDGKVGIGECGLLKGLSRDPIDDYEEQLKSISSVLQEREATWRKRYRMYPSIVFGIEQALKSLDCNNLVVFPSMFTDGKDKMSINGLIWMGSPAFMNEQIKAKIKMGYRCLKLKVGANDFKEEMDILQSIRREFSADDIELRLDANGAYNFADSLEMLKKLSKFNIHSIEQPILPNNWDMMAYLCENSPIPIALDEELIGCEDPSHLLSFIQPQYIILKPSLLGGWVESDTWISEAEKRNIGWWATSALESNIGLNAIAQWVYTKGVSMPQGLGTGQLYTNNINSPLKIDQDTLSYNPTFPWSALSCQSQIENA